MLFDIPSHRIESDGIKTSEPHLMASKAIAPAAVRAISTDTETCGSCGYRELFVVAPHCKDAHDSLGFQHFVDQAMLKVDAS